MTMFSLIYFAKSKKKAKNCIFSIVLFSKYTFFFSFELLYWNIKLDMRVKSGSSKCWKAFA